MRTEAPIPSPVRRHGRPGFTLAELLVVSVLAVLVLAAVARTLTIQGRGFQQQTTVARSQSNARLALQLLSNELKEIAATDGDLIAASESSLTVRSMRKFGIVCAMSLTSPPVLRTLKVGDWLEREDLDFLLVGRIFSCGSLGGHGHAFFMIF